MITLKELSRTPEGAVGARGLYELARKKGLKVTQEDVKTFLRQDSFAAEREHPASAVKYFRHFPQVGPNDLHFIDLLQLPPTKGTAFGSRKYLFVELDWHSRYCVAKPLTSKRSDEVLEVAQAAHREAPAGWKPGRVTVMDEGGEFSAYKKWLIEQGLRIRLATPEIHTQTSPVERINQTLARPLFRMLDLAKEGGAKRGFIDWTPLIPRIVEAYNTRTHSSTGATPLDMLQGKAVAKTPYHPPLPQKKIDERVLPPGTRVRVRLSDKETGADRTRATDRRWSADVVFVHSFEPPAATGSLGAPLTEPVTYQCCYDHAKKEPHDLLKDQQGHPYRFYREELQAVPASSESSDSQDSDES